MDGPREVSKIGITVGVLSAMCLGGLSALSWSAPKDAAVEHDGPFGIVMGEPLADVGPVQDVGAGYYKVLSPLKPNPQIASVVVVAFPSTGVCQILAESDVFADDPNAVRAKQAEDDLAAALTAKYGPPTKKVDDCDNSAGGCDTTFAMKIDQHAAQYGYGWNFQAASRPDHIGVIGALVRTYDAVRTTAGIGYLSDRTEACDKAAAATGSPGL